MRHGVIARSGSAALSFWIAAVLAPASTESQITDPSGPVYRVPVQGVIELGLAPFIERSLEEAAQAGAAAVILDVDTPGGRVDAAERITNALGDSRVPVFALVNRHAYSAGAMIALATDRIYMRPGSVIGAATPVDATGERAPEKIVSAMRSAMRALAEAHGLDPAVAEAMVDEAIGIPGVTESGQLLTLTTEEAVDLGYAVEVEDWSAMVLSLGVAQSEVVDQDVNWAELVVRFLSHPLVSPFLLSLGFLGLLVEVRTPGIGLAGLVGALSLGLFFGSHLIIGLAGLEGVLVFLLGTVLLLVEVFLVPGFGIFGALGAAAMLGGAYLSLLGGLPTVDDFTRAGSVLTGSLVIMLLGSWVLLKRLPASRRLTNLGIFLGQETSRESGFTSAEPRSDLIGAEGVALTDLRPAGTGLFGEERVDVVSDSEWIEHGSPIRIVSAEGYRRIVRLVQRPALESRPVEEARPAGGATRAGEQAE